MVQNIVHGNAVQSFSSTVTYRMLYTVMLFRVMVCTVKYGMLHTVMLYRVMVCTVKYVWF